MKRVKKYGMETETYDAHGNPSVKLSDGKHKLWVTDDGTKTRSVA